MSSFLGAVEIFNTISDFMRDAARVISWEYLLYGGVGLIVLLLIIMTIRVRHTYEVKLLKSVNAFNKYFSKNPYINDDNIVEINDRFKKVPRAFRFAWQQFMLNRDKVPSDYMNTIVCIDQPLKSSAHKNSATVTSIFTYLIAGLALFLGIAINYTFAPGYEFEGFFKVLLTPMIIIILGQLYVVFLRARNTAITTDIYNQFHTFESYINKACTTMPQYIDYEVLFTKKEIKDGIPVLQEYLEKRALLEQKEKEEAELAGGNLEKFNFDNLGVENALLLERAMTEGEKYFNLKRNLTDQINSKEAEMYNFQKNFDEVTKDFERKAQAVRESLKQLNDQLNNTTVNIEANYIKKRYKEDQQKLQQLEKDYEIASIRFNKQQQDMQNEINALKSEIEKRKADVEKSMMAEGKNYANKIYGQLNKAVVEQNKPILAEQAQKVQNVEAQLAQVKKQYEDTQIALNNTQTMLNTATHELNARLAEISGIKNLKEYLVSPEFRERVAEGKKYGKELKRSSNAEVEELRRQAAEAEKQLKIANERQKEMEEQESKLREKLKELEQNRGKESAQTKAKHDELAEINQKILKENESIKANQKELEQKVNEISQSKPAPKTSASRSSLLNNLINQAKQMENKKTDKK